MKKQKIIIMLLITAMALCILMPKSNAALQSNGGTAATQLLNDWIINIRKMESVGGTLGLTEKLNSNLASSSGSNNLDVHMIKNTEYGAIAILSASSYGNPNTITDGATTTGNETGIVMSLNGELVATAADNSAYHTEVKNVYNAMTKYKNVYNKSSTYGPKFIGDAIIETSRWHGSTNDWFSSTNTGWVHNEIVLIRANSSGIFSYNSETYDTTIKPSRAIMICGEGI